MSERTQVPLTKVHLRRLGRLADRQHAEYTRGSEDGGRLSAWADRRVAVVLAQGAALHYLHPEAGIGIKDLDVWTFYSRRPSRSLRPGRYELNWDFGRSELGRNDYKPPLSGREKAWSTFAGRRVDLLVREISVPAKAGLDTVIEAIREWLARGAREPCRHPEGRNSSAHHLAHKGMVWIGTPATRQFAGRQTWDVDADFNAAREGFRGRDRTS